MISKVLLVIKSQEDQSQVLSLKLWIKHQDNLFDLKLYKYLEKRKEEVEVE